MNSFGNNIGWSGVILIALLMLASTGCSKEEVAAPQTAVPVLQTKSGVATGLNPVDAGASIPAPISDDGDDLGDNERSNRPRN